MENYAAQDAKMISDEKYAILFRVILLVMEDWLI